MLATHLTINDLAERLGTSDWALSQWLNEDLPVEQSDVIEVAMSLFEREWEAEEQMLDQLALCT